MKAILAFLILGQIFFQNIASAESENSFKPNNTDTLKLHDLDNSLKHHSGEIISIRQEHLAKTPALQQSTKEDEYADSVLFTISEINNEVEDLVVKQDLLNSMGSEQGKAKVSTHKINDTKNFNEKCGNYLNELNLGIEKIHDVEITAQIKGARDDLVKICEIIQRWQSN